MIENQPHILVVRYHDGIPGVIITGPFDNKKQADDFLKDNRERFDKKFGDNTTALLVVPLIQPSDIFNLKSNTTTYPALQYEEKRQEN
jgi:hypothetical protein